MNVNAIRVELEVHPSIDTGFEPYQCPTLELGRHPDGFAVYEIHVTDDPPLLKEHCSPYEGIELAKRHCPEHQAEMKREPALSLARAWDWLATMNYVDDSSLIMIGPGQSSITLESPTLLPNHYRVWKADTAGAVTHVGDFLSRFSVMAVVASIINAGDCPIVATHYLGPDDEWDLLSVIRSSEVELSSVGA
jgi:hypothetical protein